MRTCHCRAWGLNQPTAFAPGAFRIKNFFASGLGIGLWRTGSCLKKYHTGLFLDFMCGFPRIFFAILANFRISTLGNSEIIPYRIRRAVILFLSAGEIRILGQAGNRGSLSKTASRESNFRPKPRIPHRRACGSSAAAEVDVDSFRIGNLSLLGIGNLSSAHMGRLKLFYGALF